MAKPVPIYREQGQTYAADACRPLYTAAEAGQVRLLALAHGHYPGKRLFPESLPGLGTAGCWDARKQQQWGLPWHRNEGIEITFLERGSLAFAVDGGRHQLRAGDLTVTRPWQRHCVGDPLVNPGCLHWVILDVGVRRPNQTWRWPPWLLLSPRDLAELTNMLRQNEQPVWRALPEIRRCFRDIAQAVEADDRGSQTSRLAIRINELLLALLELFRHHEIRLDESLSSSQRTVQLFLDDLGAHPEHLLLEWSAQEMAASCGLGVTQFVHHVRQLTNSTPLQYINRCRLERAAALLSDPARSITDIALDCGFSTSQYFATAFHRQFGCSPRAYRCSKSVTE